MQKTRLYTESEVIGILSNLVNGIGLCAKGENMPERYKSRIDVNGQEHWVTGRTLKDLLETYLELCIKEGTVIPGVVSQAPVEPNTPVLQDYISQFYLLYKQNQETLTKESRTLTIKNHILPKFGLMHLHEIYLPDVQKWFNELDAKGYSHETLIKIKNIFAPVLDAAVEDGYISRNPLRSKRLVINGTPVEHHKAIPKEKMLEIRSELPDISDLRIRFMLALLAYTGMRMEEVLGLRWEDIDFSNNWISIERAVVHPSRNKPEVKNPKSKTSKRRIPLPLSVKQLLVPKKSKGFILYSTSDNKMDTPLSYTEARRTFDKIRKQFDISDFTAHDFRDTCATEWREAGVPTDIIARMLGHAKSDITENRYVKYRDELYQGVRAVMDNQNGTN